MRPRFYETLKRQWILNPAELRSEGLKMLDQVKLQNDEVRKSAAEFFNRDRYVKPGSGIDTKRFFAIDFTPSGPKIFAF